jgi:DNA polymerase III epsilon subunit-like protein
MCGSAGVLSRTCRKKVCDSRLAPAGTEHEIDLNAEHHRALRDALAAATWLRSMEYSCPISGRLARGYRRALGSLAPRRA